MPNCVICGSREVQVKAKQMDGDYKGALMDYCRPCIDLLAGSGCLHRNGVQIQSSQELGASYGPVN